MLNENIKNLRKAKGLSQEELAIKLNVVRQTVSKWEKGLSVPDCEMLIRLAEVLETPVNVLLDKTVESEDTSEIKIIANKLEIVNEQIAEYNENRRKKYKAVSIIIFVIAICVLIKELIGFVPLLTVLNAVDENTAIIGGADGPTAILVASTAVKFLPFIITLAVAVVALIGICKNRKR
ncbi:MAG: helix-turn-helix domain-containing protein [Clostridia bacterium]|nr:helix-turn-helix domain-containing protein [Clostridia bacterium]